ncbi:MAG: hypothetical protein M3367_00915 [Acidobacteriota bacterium]|nr:hypothetical protein [Acidobacteriota bacterium]
MTNLRKSLSDSYKDNKTLAPRRIKRETESFSTARMNTDSSCELKLITELGRSLLFTVPPKKVALRVA